MIRVPASSREMSLPRIRLHYLGWPGIDPPIVLLHPNRTNGRVWDHVVACSELPNTFVAMDFRGHGLSDWPETGYALEDHVADVSGFIEKLGRGPVILVGAATGGTVGLLLATQRPDLVRALVAVDPGLSLDPSINAEVQEQIEAGQQYASLAEARAAMPFSERWSPEMQEHFAKHSFVEAEPGVWAPRYHRLAVEQTETALEQDLWDQIAPTCPLLVVRGAHSEVFDRTRLMRLAEHVPGCLVTEMPGADHRVSQDNPRGLAAVLDVFVRDLG